MQVHAITKNIRMSAQKMREVVRQIQGLPAIQAQAILAVVPRKGARFVAKTLKSAIANAENNNKADVEKLRLRVAFKGKKADIPLAKVLLGKGHETTLSAGADFHSGSQASIQLAVQGIRSIAESIPLPGSNVTIYLVDSKKVKHSLFAGHPDKEGTTLPAQAECPARACTRAGRRPDPGGRA